MAVVQYDGTDFEGFQVQSQRATVQGALEDALERLTQGHVRVVGAGRTDSGVHARAQIISFQSDWKHSLEEFKRAWNANLPAAIVIDSLVAADHDFDARRSAKSRTYRYSLNNRITRSPLRDRFAWHVPTALDVRAMHEALQSFVGTHDFIAFGNPPTEGKSSVRRLSAARCWCEVDWIIVELTANAFLQGMVRRIVGALVQLGKGEINAAEFANLLQQREKNLVKWKAPAQGLCLWDVEY